MVNIVYNPGEVLVPRYLIKHTLNVAGKGFLDKVNI